MPKRVYTKEEIDALIEEIKALIPEPMPQDVKDAWEKLLNYYMGVITE